MITQIKKFGGSTVLVLTQDFLKFHELGVGDWVDIEDIVKIKKINNFKNEKTN